MFRSRGFCTAIEAHMMSLADLVISVQNIVTHPQSCMPDVYQKYAWKCNLMCLNVYVR